MKKLLSYILALCMLLPCFPAGAEDEDRADAFLIREAVRLTQRMGAMAANGWAGFMSAAEDIQRHAGEMGAYAYDAPEAAYVYTADPAVLLSLLEDIIADEDGSDAYAAQLSGLPDALRLQMCRQILGALPSMINGFQGTTQLATASILSAGESYLAPYDGFSGAIACLVFADTPFAAIVSFVPSGEGIISASAQLTLPADNREDIAFLFERMTLRTYEGDALAGILEE